MIMTRQYSECDCPTYSPWGRADHQHRNGPGLWTVSTPSHGGIYMSPERLATFKTLFPDFEGYAGLPFLEEDLDYNLAVIAFPECFDSESVFYAVEAVTQYKSACEDGKFYFCQPRQWLLSPDGDFLRAIAAEFEAQRFGQWRYAGAAGNREGWTTYWRRGDERCATLTQEYESRRWLTDAEIKPILKPEPKPEPVKRVVIPEQRMFEEGRDWLCTGNFDGFSCGSDADPGL